MKEKSVSQFRILSLDGGGVRGILAAQILANMENYLNELSNEDINIGQRFDLLVGTSTGGLIALALALGKSASDILEFYKENIPQIFGSASKRGSVKRKWNPLYDNTELVNAANKYFYDLTLENVITDVCITSVSLQNAEPRLHKSDYAKRFKERAKEKIANIALATSAAPTYFQAHSSEYSTNLVDGGIFANNPAMVGLIETSHFDRSSKRGIVAPNIREQRIDQSFLMLSIGTGKQSIMPYKMEKLTDGGEYHWARPIYKIMMISQSISIDRQLKFLLGKQYPRVNPELKFEMDLDDVDKIDELKNLADLTEETEKFIKSNLI